MINMDIKIPGHFLKDNVLYFDSIIKIPVLRISHNFIYVSFSNDCRKSILKFIKYNNKNNLSSDRKIIFVRQDNLFMWKLDDFSYHYENLSNMLRNWANPLFYDGFLLNQFDFQLSVSNYIKYYNCMDVFNDVYDSFMSKLFNTVNREDIKKSLYSLLIDLKINTILNE